MMQGFPFRARTLEPPKTGSPCCLRFCKGCARMGVLMHYAQEAHPSTCPASRAVIAEEISRASSLST